jgi:hypothetical protein
MQLLSVFLDPDVVRFEVAMSNALLLEILNDLEKVLSKALQEVEGQASSLQLSSESVPTCISTVSTILSRVPFACVLHEEAYISPIEGKQITFGTRAC